jgi:protein phosphatase
MPAKLSELKFRVFHQIGFYRQGIERGLGVSRSWFGFGKVVGIWGGGVTPELEEAQLALLSDPSEDPARKKRLLDGIIQGRVTFDHVSLDKVREILNSLASHRELKEAAEKALVKFQPLPPTPTQPSAEELFTSSTMQLIKEVSKGVEEGEIKGKESPPPSFSEIRKVAAEDERKYFEKFLISFGKEGEISPYPELAFGLTARGGRPANQDGLAIYQLPEGKTILLVADGMGGHEEGELASDLALRTILKALGEGKTLEKSIDSAHQTILEEVRKTKERKKATPTMGSTIAAALIEKDKATFSHVGDSVIFHITPEGAFTLLTLPHWQVIEKGIHLESLFPRKKYLKESEIKELEKYRSNIIYHSLGHILPEKLSQKAKLGPGDLLLVASDGVLEALTFEEMKEILTQNLKAPVDKLGRLLKEKILENQKKKEGGDNFALILYRHPPAVRPEEVAKEEEIKRTLARYQDENYQLKEEVKIAVEKIKLLQAKVQDLEKELTQTKKEKEELASQLKLLEKLKEEEAILRKQLEEAQERVSELEEKQLTLTKASAPAEEVVKWIREELERINQALEPIVFAYQQIALVLEKLKK